MFVFSRHAVNSAGPFGTPGTDLRWGGGDVAGKQVCYLMVGKVWCGGRVWDNVPHIQTSIVTPMFYQFIFSILLFFSLFICMKTTHAAFSIHVPVIPRLIKVSATSLHKT